ncbi:MAG: hypothetical protein N4A74_08425 [Carboxylicivirga sp.]|jgi:coenzyme F420-reducing hydrogenase alpha subunit|nr:hypothetical protein [Carboxylicivirga sp.]
MLKRHFLKKNAGKYYVDENSDIVKKMRLNGKSAILGIRNKKGHYTIIGEKQVYYSTSENKHSQISLEDFERQIHEYVLKVGKGFIQSIFYYKMIMLNNDDKVWLYNSKTMFSLWSIIISLLESRPANYHESN